MKIIIYISILISLLSATTQNLPNPPVEKKYKELRVEHQKALNKIKELKQKYIATSNSYKKIKDEIKELEDSSKANIDNIKKHISYTPDSIEMLKIEIRLQEILKENISIKAENANLDTKLNILQEALRQYDKRLEVQHHIFDYVIYTVAFLGFIIIVIGTFGINRYIKKLVDNNIDKAIDDKIKEKEQILSIEIENKLIELSSKIDSMDNSLRESIKNKLQSKLIEIEKVISNKKDEIDTYTEEINQEKKKALSILKDMEKYKKDIDKSESEWIEIAFKEYNKERYNIALKYFENAEKINPNNSETLYIIGYIMDNNLNINKDKAIEYYKKAIELGETSAFNSLAYIYTFNDNYKNYKTAEDIIKLGIENNKDMTLYYNYGHILALQHKNIDSVIDSLQKAIDIDSNIKEHIRNISAFDYIKDDERFKKLIE